MRFENGKNATTGWNENGENLVYIMFLKTEVDKYEFGLDFQFSDLHLKESSNNRLQPTNTINFGLFFKYNLL